VKTPLKETWIAIRRAGIGGPEACDGFLLGRDGNRGKTK